MKQYLYQVFDIYLRIEKAWVFLLKIFINFSKAQITEGS